MYLDYYIILVVSTFAFSFGAVALAYYLLTRAQVVAEPNERSNHKALVPTGAGLAMMLMAATFLFVAHARTEVVISVFLLTIVSFVDDRKHLPVRTRLAVQLMAVLLGLGAIGGSVTQGLLPMWAELPLVLLVWMGFINLYNFMDGIDEITVTQTSTMIAGIALIAWMVPEVPRYLAIDGLVIAAAVLGFYPWNRHPASLFMGDAGSVPLGYLMAFLLFKLAASGAWAAALILPAYYLCDGGLTLLRRLLAGKKIWEAHSEHAYQVAVRAGNPHNWVTQRIGIFNLALVGLAIVSAPAVSGWVFVAAAYGAVGVLYLYFHRQSQGKYRALAA